MNSAFGRKQIVYRRQGGGSKAVFDLISAKNQKMTTSLEIEEPHVCNFVAYQPSAIRHIACTASPKNPLNPTREEALAARVAVVRADHRLEILAPAADWSIETVITTGSFEAQQVEAVCWASTFPGNTDASPLAAAWKDASLRKIDSKYLVNGTFPAKHRLFTATADGIVREWDWQRGIVKRASDTVGGPAIWSLCASPDARFVAAGHEDGRVRIYRLYSDELDGETIDENDGINKVETLEFVRTFEASNVGKKGESERIVSISWSGSIVAAGYMLGAVKLWDTRLGRSLGLLTLAEKSSKQTIVNCLHFVDTQTLATGDSSGRVQLWDVATMTILESLKTHEADVLCLGGFADKMFASGVDGKTVQIALIPTKTSVGLIVDKWTVSAGRRVHSNDVLALCLSFAFYEDDKQGIVQSRPVLLSGGLDTNLLIADPLQTAIESKDDRRIPDFPMQPHQAVKMQNGQIFALLSRKSFKVWKLSSSKPLVAINTGIVHSWDVSKDGAQIGAITGDNRFKLFTIIGDDVRAEVIPTPADCALKNVCFGSSSWYIRAVREQKNVVIKDGKEIFTVDGLMRDMFAVSDTLIVMVDYENRIHQWTRASTIQPVQLPSPPSVMHAEGGFVFVVTVDNLVLKICRDQAEPHFGIVPLGHKDRHSGISTFGDKLAVYSSGAVCLNSPSQPPSILLLKPKGKRSKSQKPSNIVTQYRPLLYYGYTEDGQPVVVRRDWEQIIEDLPPAFYRRKYGSN